MNGLLTLQLVGAVAKICGGISTAGIGCYELHSVREARNLLLEQQKDIDFVSDDDSFREVKEN